MTAPSRHLRFAVWSLLGLVAAYILLAFVVSTLRPNGTKSLPVIGAVPDFALTNQAARPTTLTDLRGQVWLADIIFTRCPGPCLEMSRRMAELQELLPALPSLKLVSLTTDPDFDTPAVLQKYAARFRARDNQWMFLTGSKAEIARLAVDGLKLTAKELAPEDRGSPEDLFIHSTIFVIVDKQGRLRGTFETQGEGVDFQETKREIVAAVKRLLAEK